MVKLPSVSGTPSESSFPAASTERRSSSSNNTNSNTSSSSNTASRDINVVLHVAPRTKLGLGICKGPEWKPGIFVQFTKERSVAREAGLRPGDQILSVNSIDFSDVLFSEAVAVMKSSSKLDMVVRTAAGCDLFPGESSGYNSSASSVTGDQSPCWADAKSKRLTAVREEPPPTGGAGQLNKTIIKLSENGTSINNTYIARQESLPKESISRSTTMRRGSCQGLGMTGTSKAAAAGGGGLGEIGAVAAMPPVPPAAPPGNGASSAAGSSSSSLSSAINEELKKRKEVIHGKRAEADLRANSVPLSPFLSLLQKQHQAGQQQVGQQVQRLLSRDRDRDRDRGLHNGSRSVQVAQVSQKRSSSMSTTTTTAAGSGGGGGAAGAGAGGDQHTALMDEFKRAHQRMFRNGFHESEHKVSSCSSNNSSLVLLLSPLAMLQQQCRSNSSNNSALWSATRERGKLQLIEI